MVKYDPLFGLRIVGAFAVIAGIGTAVWVAFRWGNVSSTILCLLMILFGAWLFWYLSPWAPVEKRRQSAAQQENTPVPLATEQPIPDELVLMLPCTIKLRPKWKIPLICFGILAPLTSTALFLYVSMVPTNPPEPAGAAPIAVAFSAFWSALVASIFALLGWRSIKVTEQGLKVQESGWLSIGCNLRTIEWSEARLFAIYPTRKRTDFPIWYELSGETTIARWRSMRPGAFSRFSKTPVPFEEYDRQMEALLSLIAAKTGLPLYDLR